jgi:hypothetical protein
LARVEVNERRSNQETRGVRSNEKLDFEQRMAMIEKQHEERNKKPKDS